MRRLCLCVALSSLMTGPALADTIVAARTIRPQTILTLDDMAIKPGDVPGGIQDPADLVGMETRVALYAGRAIRASDVGKPALIERNQIVQLVFHRHGITILTEGRALDRAAPGEFIRIMNLSSRATVSGRVMPDGRVTFSE